MSQADIQSVAPEIVLLLGGVLLLLMDAFVPSLRRIYTGIALLVTAGAAWAAVEAPYGPSFNHLLESTPATRALSLVVLLAAFLSLLGVPPTGRRVSFEWVDMYRVARGRIVWRYLLCDWKGLRDQLTAP